MKTEEASEILIRNRTLSEMSLGDSATLKRTLTREDILLFAAVSGDVNPAHVDEEFARSDMFQKIIAHGMWGAALISTVLGTELPGPGTIYLGQTLRFRRPVSVGDEIATTVTVKVKDEEKGRITFDCTCVNQKGETVISGEAEVLAPRKSISRPRKQLPEVKLFERFLRFGELIDAAEPKSAIKTAVVHPVDKVTLKNCLEAWKASLIDPVLIGPEYKIRAVAEVEGLDLSGLTIEDVQHSHAAANTAVLMAVEGEVDLIMKGSLSSDELLSVVREDSRLYVGRKASHIYALDIPTFPRALYLTDTETKDVQDLPAKIEIVQNAVDLLHAMGKKLPKVALLSASQYVDPQMQSTMDAASLCKMAERGQIVGAIVDGPMPFDLAVSDENLPADASRSPVVGNAEILVAPDMEAGSILVQQLKRLMDASAAGIILGLRVPIVLPGPKDDARACSASCALASIWKDHYRRELDRKKRAGPTLFPLE